MPPPKPYVLGPSPLGGVAERSNAAVLKTAEVARLPWVRIPPPPLSVTTDRKWQQAACGCAGETCRAARPKANPADPASPPCSIAPKSQEGTSFDGLVRLPVWHWIEEGVRWQHVAQLSQLSATC